MSKNNSNFTIWNDNFYTLNKLLSINGFNKEQYKFFDNT